MTTRHYCTAHLLTVGGGGGIRGVSVCLSSAIRSGAPSEVDALREKAAAVKGAMAQNIEQVQERQTRLDQVEETSREEEGEGGAIKPGEGDLA